MTTLRIYYDLAEARATILRRRSLSEYEVPARMADRLHRLFGEPITPAEAVRRIILSVRERGDAALREWNTRIDSATFDQLVVPEAEIDAALGMIPAEIANALEFAAERIRFFHQKQSVRGWIDAQAEGSLGQLVRPLDSVGIYVAGGTAPLPSSLLMSVIPAQVAGVREIVITTPPGRG
ncbi:MAG TPA: histidinol dehydrogenase, partial [Aggregatilineaceae bacterium]|nr:histidinol dehydrogenase [Aggregatilineaceae bacterium]